MSIPNPYFKSVPICGDLKMEQVIVDYVYPLLSVLTDKIGNRYLCMCFDTRGAQQWLVTLISGKDLASLLQNEITLASPFENPTTIKFLATLDYQTRNETFQVLDADQIPEEDLPATGEYLDAEPGEWDAYIRVLKADDCSTTIVTHELVNGYHKASSLQWGDASRPIVKVWRYALCAVR